MTTYTHKDRNGWEYLQETTKWDSEVKVPNHTYCLNRTGKCVAFINAVTGEEKVFTKPISFDKRKRTFKKVPSSTFKF